MLSRYPTAAKEEEEEEEDPSGKTVSALVG
jgi:hypothetical protein